MTSCKDLGTENNKKTMFKVAIDITDYRDCRKEIVEELRENCSYNWMTELAAIIEKG